MAIGEGCRWSFLVDVWGSSKFRRIVVAVDREGERERGKTPMLLICRWVVSTAPHHQTLCQGGFLLACH